MAQWTHLGLGSALIVALLGATACASTGDLEEVRQGLASAQAELSQAKQDLAAATQRVGAVEEQAAEAQRALTTLREGQSTLESALTTARGDLTKAVTDLGTVRSESASLRSSLNTLETGLSTTNRNLETTENLFLSSLHQFVTSLEPKVELLAAKDAKAERTRALLSAVDVYFVAAAVPDYAGYKEAAAAVRLFVTDIGDARLSTQWDQLDDAWVRFWETDVGSQEEATALEDLGTGEKAFLLRIVELLTLESRK